MFKFLHRFGMMASSRARPILLVCRSRFALLCNHSITKAREWATPTRNRNGKSCFPDVAANPLKDGSISSLTQHFFSPVHAKPPSVHHDGRA